MRRHHHSPCSRLLFLGAHLLGASMVAGGQSVPLAPLISPGGFVHPSLNSFLAAHLAPLQAAPAVVTAATPVLASSTDFTTQGLFGASYESFIMGTVGENPSDNSIHGGGYGSILSAIGPSKLDKWAQYQLGINGAFAGAAASTNPVSASFQRGLLASADGTIIAGVTTPTRTVGLAGGVSAGGVAGTVLGPGNGGVASAGFSPGHGAGVTSVEFGAGNGVGALSSAGPAAVAEPDYSNGKPGSGYPIGPGVPAATTTTGAGGYPIVGGFPTGPTSVRPGITGGIPRDSYQGIATPLGMGTNPGYTAANNIVGPANGLSGGGVYGGLGGWGPAFGIDDVGATTISSRINGIPQAVAGGRIVSRFGTGHFLEGTQAVSAWTEAPDFTKLV